MDVNIFFFLFEFTLQLEDEAESKAEEDSENQIQIKSEPSSSTNATSDQPEPVDWKPQDKCYFCVDGKLLKVNEIGELAVETGPVQPETELNKHVRSRTNDEMKHINYPVTIFMPRQIIESDDSSSSSDATQKPVNHHQHQQLPSNFIPKNLEALLKTIGVDTSMTSLESMAAAQLAAFQRLQSVPEMNHMNPFYPSRCHVVAFETLVGVFKT